MMVGEELDTWKKWQSPKTEGKACVGGPMIMMQDGLA